MPVLLAANSQQTPATEYSVEPRIQTSTEFNTNRRLNGRGADDDVLGAGLDVGAALGVRTPRSELLLVPRVRVTRYTGESDLDTEEGFVDLSASHALTPRLSSELEASYTRDSALTSELEDTGILDAQVDRERIEAAPSLRYQLSPHDAVEIRGNYIDVDYKDPGDSGLVDFDFLFGSLSYTRALGPSDSVFATVLASDFETGESPGAVPSTQSETRSIGGQLGYTRVFSDRTTATAAVGVIHSDIEFFEIERAVDPRFPFLVLVREVESETTETGLLLDLSLSHDFDPVTSADASFSRAVTPSGRGAQTTTDELELELTRRLQPRLTGSAGVRFSRRSAQGDGAGASLDRDFWRARGRLRWRMDRFWTVIGEYIYRRQDFDGGATFDAHAIMLNFRYRGDLTTFSR